MTGRALRWLLAALVALFVLQPWTAAAQDEELAGPADGAPLTPQKGRLLARVEPLADGLVREGEWAVVRARIANGGESTPAVIRLTQADLDGGGSFTYERHVELPSGTVKDLDLYWRPNMVGGPRRLEILPSRGKGGTVQFPASPVSTSSVAVATLGGDPVGLPVISTAWSGLVPSRAPRDRETDERSVRHGLIPLDAMPERSVGYDAFDWVVWPQADPGRVSAEQLDALRHWVADGGHLLVTVTDRWQEVAGSALGDLLPVTLTGLRDAPDIDPLMAAVGGRAKTTGPVPVATGILRQVPGRWTTALARLDDDAPVWAVGTYGLGSVHVVLADPKVEPLTGGVLREDLWRRLLWLPRDGDGARWLWRGLERADGYPDPRRTSQPLALALRMDELETGCALEPGGHEYDWQEGAFDGEVRGELADIPGVAPLPLSWLIAFSVVYLLAIGPVDYLVLRWAGRQPLTWVTFPVTIAVFSGVALYGTSVSKGSQSVMTRLEIVDYLPGTALARGDTWLGAFATGRTQIALRSGFPDGVVTPVGNGGFMEAPTMRSSEGAGELAYQAQTWTLGYARSRWTGPASGGVSVEADPDGWTVRSELPYSLAEAHLVVLGRSFDLGALDPGEVVRVSRRADTTVFQDGWFVRDQFSEHDEGGRGHLHHAHNIQVIGVTDRAVEPLELGGLRPVVRAATLVRVPVAHPAALLTDPAFQHVIFSTEFDGGEP